MPISESLRAFRETLPNIRQMKVGDHHFIPCFDPREDFVIHTSLRRINARISDRRWFGLLEWRSYIRGRLVVCVSLEQEPAWHAVWKAMQQAGRINKKPPPLDRLGNALVPRLPPL